MAAPTQKRAKPKSYAALVYFHGIGEQRRYEEVSFLINALEQYGKDHAIPLQRIEVQSEPVRDEEQDQLPRSTVEYVRACYKPKDTRREQEYRFYLIIASGLLDWIFRFQYRRNLEVKTAASNQPEYESLI